MEPSRRTVGAGGGFLLAAFVALTAACGGGGGPDLEFADWLFPVPEGTPVKEYAPVALADRDPEAVRLVEDLVIGGDPDDPNTLFYTPSAVMATDAGDIFVAEFGNKRVQMFSSTGEFVKTIGSEGQGPGEFEMPFSMIEAGDRFAVIDMQNRRISIFSATGDHVSDQPLAIPLFTNYAPALADGTFVVLANQLDAARNRTFSIERYSIEGERLAQLYETPGPPTPPRGIAEEPMAQVQYSIDSAGFPRPDVGAAGEVVYVSPSTEYQVLAMTPAGEPLWALRVAWPRPPYPERLKQQSIEMHQERVPGISAGDFRWPEAQEAVASLRTDGAGRLYVFPNISEADADALDGRPVDVYSPAGERLAAGIVKTSWMTANGDYLYTLRGDADLDQPVVVRYRLELVQR